MASFHGRSNSFPSQAHPIVNDVYDHLERLKATSTSSICRNLASLRELHDGINDLIQMPWVQQGLAREHGQTWIYELVEESLRLVDLCEFSRDAVCLTKESLQELESSIRRKSVDINSYMASRKKVSKMVFKFIKNLKISSQNCTGVPEIIKLLKEAESRDLSILKSVLILVTRKREKSRKKSLLFSKLTQSATRVHSGTDRESEAEDLCSLNIEKSMKKMDRKTILKQLKASETSVQEIEECLEALFRSLVKTRVYLLNALSH